MTGPSHISSGITRLPVQKVSVDHHLATQDPVVVEEPLEIMLEYGPAGARTTQPVSVTMRTPGHDTELALGFLFTEGIIPDRSALLQTGVSQNGAENGAEVNAKNGTENTAKNGTEVTTQKNAVKIALAPTATPDLKKLQRHFYTSSSCGVCGKTSIEALHTSHQVQSIEKGPVINASILYTLPALLRQGQDLFDFTGGLHAAGLFDNKGRLILVREDIGRHNALDKLIGHALLHDQLPLNQHILLLSGRACFELIQKAAVAGIAVVAAVGPPSSLAVRLAEESGITLVGFLKQKRFNIYSGAHRILL